MPCLIAFVKDRGARFPLCDRCREDQAELGWQPSATLDEGLRRTVSRYLAESRLVAGDPSNAGTRWSGWGPGGGALMRALIFGTTGQSRARVSPCPPRWGRVDRARPRRGRSRRRDTCARAVRDSGGAVVINAAAHTAVDRAENEPELAYAVNALAPGAMAVAAADIGCRCCVRLDRLCVRRRARWRPDRGRCDRPALGSMARASSRASRRWRRPAAIT